MSQDISEHTFSVTSTPRLTLSNIRGSVEIQSGDDDVICVTAVKHLDSGDLERTQIEIAQAEDGSVSVETRYLESGRQIFRRQSPCKVDYSVRVPHACSMKVSGVSVTTSIHGSDGELEITTVSGSLTLNELSGRLMIKTVSGQVNGETLSGSLRVKTVSGDVRLSRSHFSYVDAKTVSGDITLQTSLNDGSYRFKSVSGIVRLIVPPETGCTVQSRSLSGHFKTPLPTTREQHRNRVRYSQVRNGGSTIQHNSISGDLHLLLSNDTAPMEVAVAHTLDDDTVTASAATNNASFLPSRPSHEIRMDVLERISRGELSVEEGLNALQN